MQYSSFDIIITDFDKIGHNYVGLLIKTKIELVHNYYYVLNKCDLSRKNVH